MRPWVITGLFLARLACAQDQNMPDMPGMKMSDKNMPGMDMPGMEKDPAAQLLMNQASGTSMNPQAGDLPMVMNHAGDWQFMFMGQAFLNDTQQNGPRGADKLYSTNWFMMMTQHALGPGTFQLQTMFSLEPATVENRSYPLLFQTGETAYGRPLVDAQHPHNFFMGLGVTYAVPVGENSVFQIYIAPVGDPALGPVAFPHRLSASELPEAPLGHHWQDSTHIADDVITAAWKYRIVRLEASGFYGSEPGENRWIIQQGPINSWSARASIFPTKNWMAQVSMGRLARPERQTPGDVVRVTGSVHYSVPERGAVWASSFIWGRNHDLLTRSNQNSYLLESVLPVSRKNFLTGRAELVDKNELFANDVPLEQHLAETAGTAFRIGAYTIGYTRDIGTFEHAEVGLGANVTAYTLPDAIKPYYGNRPAGVNVFLRVRLK